MKRCPSCEKDMQESKFSKNKTKMDGLQRSCKECEKTRQGSISAREQRRGYAKSPAGKVRRGVYNSKYVKSADGKLTRKHSQIKYLYGLSRDQYLSLIESILFCEICNRPFSEHKPCVDHDHNNGKVRGLLCKRCNMLLGHAKDSIDILKSAISYLGRAASTAEDTEN